MNPFLDRECFECIAKLALYVGSISSGSGRGAVEKALELAEIFAREGRGSLDDYVELSSKIAEAVARCLGDPYAAIRRASMELAFRLLPVAERYIREGRGDELARAASVAVTGNALDFAAGVFNASLERFEAEFEGGLREPFTIDHLGSLAEELEGARTVLYALDNAGECVLDLPLVKLLSEGRRVVVAARGAPVFNDATLVEAREAGLGSFAELTTTGCRVPGVSVRRCSSEFLRLLAEADVAILKGQGNLQSLNEVERVRRRPAYYLFVPSAAP